MRAGRGKQTKSRTGRIVRLVQVQKCSGRFLPSALRDEGRYWSRRQLSAAGAVGAVARQLDGKPLFNRSGCRLRLGSRQIARGAVRPGAASLARAMHAVIFQQIGNATQLAAGITHKNIVSTTGMGGFREQGARQHHQPGQRDAHSRDMHIDVALESTQFESVCATMHSISTFNTKITCGYQSCQLLVIPLNCWCHAGLPDQRIMAH